MGGQFRSLGRQIEGGGGGLDHRRRLRRRLRRRRHRGQTRLAACFSFYGSINLFPHHLRERERRE